MEYAYFPDSTAVAWAAYDRGRRILYVTFRDSMRTYSYRRVPPQKYQELLDAESKGTYVNQCIKPVYRFEEVIPSPASVQDLVRMLRAQKLYA
jgi:hypothetical protein